MNDGNRVRESAAGGRGWFYPPKGSKWTYSGRELNPSDKLGARERERELNSW